MKDKHLFKAGIAILMLDALLLAIFIGSGISGIYSIGKTILLVCMILVSMACGLLAIKGCKGK